MALSLIAAPAVEPITLFEAKRQCKAPSDSSEDGLIVGLITAARERVEAITGRQLIEATFEQRGQCFDECAIVLPKPPLRSVTAITYVDANGVTQTWSSANYQVDAPAGPYAERGRVAPIAGGAWPIVKYDTWNAAIVRFKAGYGTTPATVPMSIRQAMLLMIGAWYVNREDMVSGGLVSVPLGALALVTPYKVYA